MRHPMTLNFREADVSAGDCRSIPGRYSLSSVTVVTRKVVWVGIPSRRRVPKIAGGILLLDFLVVVRDLNLIDNLM